MVTFSTTHAQVPFGIDPGVLGPRGVPSLQVPTDGTRGIGVRDATASMPATMARVVRLQGE